MKPLQVPSNTTQDNPPTGQLCGTESVHTVLPLSPPNLNLAELRMKSSNLTHPLTVTLRHCRATRRSHRAHLYPAAPQRVLLPVAAGSSAPVRLAQLVA